MTFLISNSSTSVSGMARRATLRQFAAIVVFLIVSVVGIHAQQPSAADMLNQVARLERLVAMQPDSIQPRHQLALQRLNFAVLYPQAPQTEQMLTQAEETIAQLEKTHRADPSDLCTLRGFLYMARIVQNPAQNGQRYYIDVQQNFEKALKLNPDNRLAQQLQQRFLEGMKQATGR